MIDIPVAYITAPYIAPSVTAVLGSSIQIRADTAAKAYAELPCSQEDMARIHEIITTISGHGKISLLFKQSHLKHLGAQIRHVHPLKFLSTIVTNPELKSCLHEIFNDYFKRGGFMDGLAPSLTREADKGRLNQHIEEFAKDVGVPKEEIRPYFLHRNWEGLARYFIIKN